VPTVEVMDAVREFVRGASAQELLKESELAVDSSIGAEYGPELSAGRNEKLVGGNKRWPSLDNVKSSSDFEV